MGRRGAGRRGAGGYVSTWHDACREVRTIALAYDQVAGAVANDRKLVAFLSRRAEECRLKNAKRSARDIRRNIEERILRDTLEHRAKIQSNYPETDVTLAVIRTILEWPGNRDEIAELIDAIVERSTAVDGLTGEKGLAGYRAIGPRGLASMLGRFDRVEPDVLARILERHPRLRQTYRFHIDTWCGAQYYPRSGDTGFFAGREESYKGVSLGRSVSLEPSGFTFLWRLYELTGDADFVKVIYRANGNAAEGLPYDLFARDPASIQRRVAEVIAREGAAERRIGAVPAGRLGEGVDAVEDAYR